MITVITAAITAIASLARTMSRVIRVKVTSVNERHYRAIASAVRLQFAGMPDRTAKVSPKKCASALGCRMLVDKLKATTSKSGRAVCHKFGVLAKPCQILHVKG